MTSLKGQIEQSYTVLKNLTAENVTDDQQIPRAVLKNAKGLCFISQIKAGFVFSGTIGAGIIIRRTPGVGLGWSAPSSVGTAGMGWGLQIGAQKTDTLIVLHDESQIAAFSGNGQLKFGGDVSLAVGPVGRSAAADARLGDGGATGCFSYSHSQGLFGGLTLEGAALLARASDNESFYGRKVSPKEILAGEVEPPRAAYPLYELLNNLCLEAATEPGTGMKEKKLVAGGGSYAVAGGEASASPASGLSGLPDNIAKAIDGTVPPPPGRALPAGWVAIKTPEDETYYHHAEKGETSWEFPTA